MSCMIQGVKSDEITANISPTVPLFFLLVGFKINTIVKIQFLKIAWPPIVSKIDHKKLILSPINPKFVFVFKIAWSITFKKQ